MSDAYPQHRRLSFRGLTFQLFVITILPLTVLLVAITFGSLELHQQAMRRMVGERDMLAVHTATAALEQQVQQRANTLRLLAAQIAAGSDLNALAGQYEFLPPDFDRGLAVLAPDGQLQAVYGDQAFWQNLAAGAPGFTLTMESSEQPAVLPNHFRDPDSGEQIVVILTPVDEGRLAAGAVTAAGLAQRVFSAVTLEGHHTSFLLVGADGQTIYQVGHLFNTAPAIEHSGVVEALRGESGATFQRVGESEHVVAYSPVPALEWALISEEPWEMVDSPTLRATQSTPLILIPALFLTLVALGFAVRQIVRPLQDLQARAAQLAQGNFDAIEVPVGGIEEIRRLQAGLAQMAQQLKAAQRSLHDYIGAITSAQEDERRRLARELHDDTIQALIALKQRVDLARMDLRRVGAITPLDEIAGLTEETIANLRRLTRALRPIYLEDLGLSTALEMLALETGQAAGISVSFELQGEARRLPPQVELALYRMAQEALNNVARHAGATRARESLAFDQEGVALEIKDDGKGFQAPTNPSEFAPGGHYGLLGMHERAELIGARLEISSAPGKGTCLRVTLPAFGDNHQ
jgi:signal transduction histidine kinase